MLCNYTHSPNLPKTPLAQTLRDNQSDEIILPRITEFKF